MYPDEAESRGMWYQRSEEKDSRINYSHVDVGDFLQQKLAGSRFADEKTIFFLFQAFRS